jgi:cell wall-associated NlpC family hydrolase
VLHSVQDLLGIRYVKNGKLPDGLDCYSLVQEVFRREGIDLPEYDSPEESSLIHLLLTGDILKYAIPLEEPEPLCVVRFCIVQPYIRHVGVVLDNCTTFIHIREKANVAIERLDHRFWAPRIRGYFKWNPCSL